MLVKVFEVFVVPAVCSTLDDRADQWQKERNGVFVSWGVNKRALTPRCGCAKMYVVVLP